MEPRYRYRTFEHTADLGLEVTADRPEDLFAGAALALATEIAAGELPAADGGRKVEAEGYDPESLLVRWLSEWLVLAEVERVIPVGFDAIELGEESVRAAARTAGLAEASCEIKAVTYHGIEVRLEPGRCLARVVLDR